MGKTDNAHHKIQTINLFLLSGLSSIYENIYAHITIGKKEISAKTMYIIISKNIKYNSKLLSYCNYIHFLCDVKLIRKKGHLWPFLVMITYSLFNTTYSINLLKKHHNSLSMWKCHRRKRNF